MNQPLPLLLHALLFTTGETWRFSELAKTFSVTGDEITAAIHTLQEQLQNQAVYPLVHEQTVMLVTQPEFKDFLQSLDDGEIIKEFSKGALETLALIAYNGPITKSDIDYIRGVNSQFMIRNLIMRGMIEKQTSQKSSGYCITIDALRYLGVTDVGQLPHFDTFHQEITKRIPLEE